MGEKAGAQLPLSPVAVLGYLSAVEGSKRCNQSLHLEGWKATAEDKVQKSVRP